MKFSEVCICLLMITYSTCDLMNTSFNNYYRQCSKAGILFNILLQKFPIVFGLPPPFRKTKLSTYPAFWRKRIPPPVVEVNKLPSMVCLLTGCSPRRASSISIIWHFETHITSFLGDPKIGNGWSTWGLHICCCPIPVDDCRGWPVSVCQIFIFFHPCWYYQGSS